MPTVDTRRLRSTSSAKVVTNAVLIHKLSTRATQSPFKKNKGRCRPFLAPYHTSDTRDIGCIFG